MRPTIILWCRGKTPSDDTFASISNKSRPRRRRGCQRRGWVWKASTEAGRP